MAAILAKTLAAAAAFGAVSCVLPDREADAPLVRPNIVLMVVEDLSLRIGAFGDPVARTPNIDRLAREGVRYTEIFTASGVCAPSRAALITGMHPSSITAQHMRSRSYSWDDASGRTGYFATPPAHVKAFPELLRAAGYYTTNNAKTDYQIGSPFTIWDENGPEAHWTNASAGQPFFAMYSQTATHESGLFDPNSISEAYRSSAGALQALAQQRAALSQRTRPEDVVVPPYYPDTPTVRADIARQYDNVQVMDAWVGERMEELRRAGVLENTIVIWTTDHGDGLPRGKRSLYDSGLHVPTIIRFPDGRGAGTSDMRLISFVDLAPTILAMAGVPAPPPLHGIDVLQPLSHGQEQVFAARDRLDEWPDLSRAVRTPEFKYIRNEYPDAPFYLPLAYRENVPMMAEMRRLASEGKLSPLQASYFRTPRLPEELYDLRADPHEINNLADDPAYGSVKAKLAGVLAAWRARIGDAGKMPEDQMIKAAWGAESQPQTTKPVMFVSPGGNDILVKLASETEGASIGYRFEGETRWRLYTRQIDVRPGTRIEAKAIRYGFKESEVMAAVAE